MTTVYPKEMASNYNEWMAYIRKCVNESKGLYEKFENKNKTP